MRISVDLPETATFAQDASNHRLAKEAFVSTLYNLGLLSEKEACDTLGLSRRVFEDLLPRFGFSVLSDDPLNLELELQA